MLDLVNAEFTAPGKVNEILGKWVHETATPSAAAAGRGSVRSSSYAWQISTLLRRHCLLVLRDPNVFLGRCVMFCLGCLFFAIVYFKSRDRVQELVLSRAFLIMWHVGMPTALSVVAV